MEFLSIQILLNMEKLFISQSNVLVIIMCYNLFGE